MTQSKLEDLLNGTPDTLKGQFNQRKDQVKLALQAGYRKKTIWKALREDGLKISYGQFTAYVRELIEGKPPRGRTPATKKTPITPAELKALREREIDLEEFRTYSEDKP